MKMYGSIIEEFNVGILVDFFRKIAKQIIKKCEMILCGFPWKKLQ